MSEWVSVKDRLPEVGMKVLIYSGYGDIFQAELLPDLDLAWVDYNQEDTLCQSELPTHWMPLPEPPEES